LLPASTPLSSKNFLYIKCSFVAGFNINKILLCIPLVRILKSILSNISSSVSSSASSKTNVVTPAKDFKDAVCVPLLVLIPLNRILEPVFKFTISSFVI
jgi:hypothetical protein